MKILGIIPARYASTRFPAKALVDIQGKSMIRRVYEQAKKASLLSDVVVATDHEAIKKEVEAFGGKVAMTSPAHRSGTDRCAEVLKQYAGQYDYVINIQGDEPFIVPEQIDILAKLLTNGSTQLGTLAFAIRQPDEVHNPNVVKVVVGTNGNALYFSRNPLPYLRDFPDKQSWHEHHTYYKHVGIYAYRADVLERITQLQPSSLELAESLEQLRWLENGFSIRVGITPYESVGIDTPEDLEKVLKTIR